MPPVTASSSSASDATPKPRVVLWVIAAIAAVQFLQWTLVLPEDVQQLLGFRRSDLETGRWWTALTYPFVHADVSLALVNGYALTVFGSRLEREWHGRRFLAFLGVAAIGGWILHLFLGGSGMMLGASSAAFATLAAYGLRWGRDEHGVVAGLEVHGRWLTLFAGTVLLLVGLRESVGGGVGFLAHLGGIGAAWLFVRLAPVQLVERLREGVNALPDDPPDDQLPRAVPKSMPRSRARDRESIDDVLSRTNAAAARRATPRRRLKPEDPPTAPPSLDAILDKISAEGMAGLTDDERRVLDDHSRRLRDE
jgi:membrane associated rhomboid family serine protease